MSCGIVYDVFNNPGIPVDTPIHILDRIKSCNICSKVGILPMSTIAEQILQQTPVDHQQQMIKTLNDMDFYGYCNLRRPRNIGQTTVAYDFLHMASKLLGL